MKKIEAKKRIEETELSMQVESRIGDLNRARSITVGTAFGGTTEVMMRGDGGRHLWCLMQPVEVIELIHQLSANVGCHVALKPRDDFGSWRDWRVSEAEKKHLTGHPHFVNDMSVFQQLGASGFNQAEADATVSHNLEQKEYEYTKNGSAVSKNQPTKTTKKQERSN